MKNLKYYSFWQLNKKLRIGYSSVSGRNFTGQICVRHRSGGSKRKEYFIDFYRRINSIGFVLKIIKSRFFSSFIGLVIYANGLSSYILLSEHQKRGSIFFSGNSFNKDFLSVVGCAMPLYTTEIFYIINNVELLPYKGSSLLRAAGARGVITSMPKNSIILKLFSGWNLILSNKCLATLGMGSNSQYHHVNFKKAGIKRLLGWRPTVRGVAMNPCDHPHGGGEGKASGSVAARSPWGKLCKGSPTKKKLYFLKKKRKYKNIRT